MRAPFLLTIALVCVAAFSGNKEKTAAPVKPLRMPLPPLVQGGLSSLWYHDHQYLHDTYGEFELINYANAGFTAPRDSLTACRWEPFVLGEFDKKEISYATLARVKNSDEGLLLVLFRWVEPSDTGSENGVYFHAFTGRDTLLLRTKQNIAGGLDTLEISCGASVEIGGACYYAPDTQRMKLTMRNEQ